MTSASLGSLLQFIILILSALTAVRLLTAGLYKRYLFFFLFLVFRVAYNACSLSFQTTSSSLYFYFWVSTEPVVLAFYILLVAELYRLVLENYRGLHTVGRWAMYASLAVSVTISVLSLLPKLKPNMPQRSKALVYLL